MGSCNHLKIIGRYILNDNEITMAFKTHVVLFYLRKKSDVVEGISDLFLLSKINFK